MKRINKIEMLIGRIVLNILGGLLGVGLVLGFFWVLGLIEQVIENNFWLMIPLTIYVIYLMLKEI